MLSNFCKEHASYYRAKSNEEMLEDLSYTVRDSLSVTPERKIAPVRDIKVWARFTNLFNEMINRGYQYEELMRAIGDTQDAKGVLDDIFAAIGHNPKWKKFEKLVTAVHMARSNGAKVTYDDKVAGKRTGRERQIDISVRFEHSFYTYFVVVECKDYKTAVPISDVEAFKTKLEDVGADKGVMVASNGFQQGAIETANAHNIELFTLEAEHSAWISRLREFSFTLPFPRDITFDHPPIPKSDQNPSTRPISFTEILFFRDPSMPPKQFASILQDICLWAHNTRLKLPARVDVKFDEPYLMKVPERVEYIPVYGMTLTMVQYRYAQVKKIDMPPTVMHYKYTDIMHAKTHKVSLNEQGDQKV
jgi:hypothetical protein